MVLEQIAVRISDTSHVSEARRAASRLARSLTFSETEEGYLAIVVTELARNVLLHGGGGEIVLQPAIDDAVSQLDVLALDRGRGISNLADCLQDGYSSAGTPGTGLGAVRRIASLFDLYTRPAGGTAILARMVASPKLGALNGNANTGSVCVPIPGEDRCGDAWELREENGRRVIVVADGLGHGPAASDAAQEAIEAFRANAGKSPKEILEAAHQRLQKTRGAAVAVVEIDFERGLARYSGIGNISGTIVHNGKPRSMVSHNGIVGHQAERRQEFTFPWERDALLIMHSDGVGTKWALDQYPGLQSKPAALIAGVLYRDFKRGRDDATVVVSRERKAS